jgi:site-specific DNA recombinase
MPVAAIYARVSSARQREEQTIASQTAALRDYAAGAGVEVPSEWVFEDEGYSGATLIRPALERLRDLVAEVGVSLVLCYSPDRLARRYVYQALLIEEFSRAGAEVQFVKGPKAQTPEDELLLQFQGMIAEYEKAQIAERTRRGKIHRARMGDPAVLSGAPYGYRYVRKTIDSEARYEPVESEAAVVRAVFQRYVGEHVSIGELASWLTEQGIPTATGKRVWDRSTVWGMLRNPAYCGRAAFGKTQRVEHRPRLTRRVRLRGARMAARPARSDRPREQWVEVSVPAIVSEEQFELAERRLRENQHFARRRTKVPSLLQGLVVCQGCGYSYYRTSTRTRTRKLYYYRCLGSDDYRFEHGRICHNRPVRQDYLDALVWEQVMGLLENPSRIGVELDRRLRELRSSHPVAVQRFRVERERSKVATSISRLVDAYQEQLLSLAELRRRLPALRKREVSLATQLQSLDAQAVDQETYLALAQNLEAFTARLRESARQASIAERQRVVRLLVKEVLVGPERILIRHSIPTSRPDPTPGYLLCRNSPLTAPGQHRPCSTSTSHSSGKRSARHGHAPNVVAPGNRP